MTQLMHSSAHHLQRRSPLSMGFWLSLILVVTLSLCGCSKDKSQPLPGAGQWRVINWWAVWCAPCRDEIPELNQLAKDPSMVVLGVNFDGKVGDALQVDSERLGIEFTLLEDDPATQLGVPRPTVLPTTLIVNPEGVVVVTLVGPQTERSLRSHMTKEIKGG